MTSTSTSLPLRGLNDLADLGDLDVLLTDPAFTEPAPPAGPERHARTYRRLAALGRHLGGVRALHERPDRMLAALEWAATVDPSLFLAGMVQHAVCAEGLLSVERPGAHLSGLIDRLDRQEAFGCILITELGWGNSHLSPATEAHFDPESRDFVLRTPEPAAAKFMAGVARADGRGRVGAVFARLMVGGEPCGVFPFAVYVHDGERPADGVTIRALPETTAVPLDYALVTFDGTRVPYDAWVRDNAEISPDGFFHDPLGDPERRLVRSLSVSSNASTSAAVALAAAARASVTVGLRYAGRRRTMGRLGADMPVLRYDTQREALYGALAETYACDLLVSSVREDYLLRRSAADDGDHQRPERPVWAPWTSVNREQALAKVAAVHALERAAGVSRARSGAQGLLAVNRLLEYEGLAHVFQAAAGDNLLIRLDAGKQLVEDAAYDPPPVSTLRPTDYSEPATPEMARALAVAREREMLRTLRRRSTERAEQDGRSPFDLWNPLLPHLVRLADAHIERLTLDCFAMNVARCDDPAALAALRPLQELYGAELLERNLGWHLEHLTISPADAAEVHRARERALEAVHPHVPALVEGLGIPGARLRAPIAEPDYVAAVTAACSPPSKIA
ncbi:acyl-CoA oxidase [Nonomuraea solani]|uniref:Acyl-CoA oxidase n=1 Tax=Nonomuraea solani TaxID=1144553 RepID=A0A1H6EEQ2_9ACTN|nr:acyl-CoA dehydrogenase [Nonomuraea solani]SEG95436.1 acyl-CoA oxidase [Nonomuraea solani]